MKIVAVIPAYNEGGRIGETILDAARFVDAVVVVDDCSKDTTGVEARAHGAHLLTHLVNCGQGAALQTGMDYALKILRAEIVVHFDADGQMRGEEIPMMVKPIVDGQVDVTLGSRFLGKAENIPLARRWMLKAAVVFIFDFGSVALGYSQRLPSFFGEQPDRFVCVKTAWLTLRNS